MQLQVANDSSASRSTSEFDTTSVIQNPPSPDEQHHQATDKVVGRVISPRRSVSSPTEFFAPRREWEKKMSATDDDSDLASAIDADYSTSDGSTTLANNSSDELAPWRGVFCFSMS